jgi:hypothetical protein
MTRALMTITAALMLSAGPNSASASEEGAAAGIVTGAVAGAVVGGPVGAVIGAVVGGVTVGTATGPNAHVPPSDDPPDVSSRGPAVGALAGPETTGTVVETRTCVRDARGIATCRKNVAR